jgi:hypothetical protein
VKETLENITAWIGLLTAVLMLLVFLFGRASKKSQFSNASDKNSEFWAFFKKNLYASDIKKSQFLRAEKKKSLFPHVRSEAWR